MKETILKLSYLYGIGPLQMKNILLGSLDSDEAIDVEQLRKSARDWYQLQTGDELPDLTPKAKPVNKEASKPLTREEELLSILKAHRQRMSSLISPMEVPHRSRIFRLLKRLS